MTPHGVLFNNMLANVPVSKVSPHVPQTSHSVPENTNSETGSSEKKISNATEATTVADKLVDPPREGRVRPLTPYAPFIVLDKHHVRKISFLLSCYLFFKPFLGPMYHRQQNKCYPQRCQIIRKTARKFDCCNKFDCYYGQVNSLWLISSVASKWANIELNVTFGGNIYFAGDDICLHQSVFNY